MTRTAIVVFSDPSTGSEEALGRVLNALFLTKELLEKSQAPALIFQGAGTRWPAVLSKPGHPANAIYNDVRQAVAGVCGGCADVFGATPGAMEAGSTLVRDRPMPGTSGIIDLSRYLDEGFRLLTF